MNKLILLIGVFLSFLGLTAQENWLFHPSIGINFTPVDDNSISGVAMKSGLNASINFIQQVEERWSLDYGLSVNKRFSSHSFSEESDELVDLLNIGNVPVLGDFDFTIYTEVEALTSYWTVDLPITTTFSFNSGFFLFGGGYLNYLMGASHKEKTTTHIPIFEVINPEDLGFIDPALIPFIPENSVETETIDSKENLRQFGYGVIGGLGYMSKTVILKLNYQHGLTDIRSDDMNMNISFQRTVQLSIGYLFDEIFSTSKEKPIYDLDVIE